MPVKAKTINAASDTAGRATGQGRRKSGPTWNPCGARMPGRVPGWPSVPLSAGRSGEPRPRTHHRHRHGRGGDRDRRTPARTAKGVQGGCRASGGGTTERPPRIRARAPRAEPVGGSNRRHPAAGSCRRMRPAFPRRCRTGGNHRAGQDARTDPRRAPVTDPADSWPGGIGRRGRTCPRARTGPERVGRSGRKKNFDGCGIFNGISNGVICTMFPHYTYTTFSYFFTSFHVFSRVIFRPSKKSKKTPFLLGFFGILIGRSGGIWTHGLLLPKQTRYQAALRSDIVENGV